MTLSQEGSCHHGRGLGRVFVGSASPKTRPKQAKHVPSLSHTHIKVDPSNTHASCYILNKPQDTEAPNYVCMYPQATALGRSAPFPGHRLVSARAAVRNDKPRMCPHASLWPPEAASHGGRPTCRRFDSSSRWPATRTSATSARHQARGCPGDFSLRGSAYPLASVTLGPARSPGAKWPAQRACACAWPCACKGPGCLRIVHRILLEFPPAAPAAGGK